MSEIGPSVIHISSAVVRALPERAAAVAESIDSMPGAQVFGREDGRIVVVLEGPSSKALGAHLSEIALLDGVLAAGMVYEQIDTVEPVGEAP